MAKKPNQKSLREKLKKRKRITNKFERILKNSGTEYRKAKKSYLTLFKKAYLMEEKADKIELNTRNQYTRYIKSDDKQHKIEKKLKELKENK